MKYRNKVQYYKRREANEHCRKVETQAKQKCLCYFYAGNFVIEIKVVEQKQKPAQGEQQHATQQAKQQYPNTVEHESHAAKLGIYTLSLIEIKQLKK